MPRRKQELGHAPADGRRARIAEKPLRRGIEVDDAVAVVDGDDGIDGSVEDGALARLAVGESALGAPPRGDVLADAAISGELARLVEDRLAAERDPGRAAAGGDALHLEVLERLVALELRAVPGPVLLAQVRRRLLPASAAEIGARIEAGLLLEVRRHERDPESCVLLPVPVRRELEKAAEALFAFAQR